MHDPFLTSTVRHVRRLLRAHKMRRGAHITLSTSDGYNVRIGKYAALTILRAMRHDRPAGLDVYSARTVRLSV